MEPGDHGYDGWMAMQNKTSSSHEDPDNFVSSRTARGKREGYSACLVKEAVRGFNEKRAQEEAPVHSGWYTRELLPFA